MAFAPSFMVLATIPFTDKFQFADIGVGLLYYLRFRNDCIWYRLGGWASNNKYALLGGMRAAAQMISYEIPLVMSVLGVILLTGSLNLNDIVARTGDTAWFILLQPVAFIVFFIASIAELNRTPFDLPEAKTN